MKFLPQLEKGDDLPNGKVVWKVVLLYIDTEGVIHEDQPKECPKAFAHDQLARGGWTICFSCGTELVPSNAFTADLLDDDR